MCRLDRRLMALFSLPWILVVVGACGLSVQQRAAVERFSAATIDFTTLSSNELVKSRTDVVDMNTLRAKLGDPEMGGNGPIDEHFTVARVKQRTDALVSCL